MTMDLSEYTRQELEELKARVETELQRAAEREREAALAAAERAAREHGFSLAELSPHLTAGPQKKSRGKKSKNAPKYRNPAKPDQTWSGIGRKPAWIKEAEAAGRPLDDFLIENVPA